MADYKIPENVRSKIDRIYQGADRDRVVEALEAGKTVYHGRIKLRAVKIKKREQTIAKPDVSASGSPPAKAEPEKPEKEKSKA